MSPGNLGCISMSILLFIMNTILTHCITLRVIKGSSLSDWVCCQPILKFFMPAFSWYIRISYIDIDLRIKIPIRIYWYINVYSSESFYRTKVILILGKYIHTQFLVIQDVNTEQLGARQYVRYTVNTREFFPQTSIYLYTGTCNLYCMLSLIT